MTTYTPSLNIETSLSCILLLAYHLLTSSHSPSPQHPMRSTSPMNLTGRTTLPDPLHLTHSLNSLKERFSNLIFARYLFTLPVFPLSLLFSHHSLLPTMESGKEIRCECQARRRQLPWEHQTRVAGFVCTLLVQPRQTTTCHEDRRNVPAWPGPKKVQCGFTIVCVCVFCFIL